MHKESKAAFISLDLFLFNSEELWHTNLYHRKTFNRANICGYGDHWQTNLQMINNKMMQSINNSGMFEVRKDVYITLSVN